MLVARKNQDLIPTLFRDLLDMDNWERYSTEPTSRPKMNVSESDADYEMELSVPGLSKEDLTISIDSENHLLVEMLKKEESKSEDTQRHCLRREFGLMQFKQQFDLPENVKKERITAKVENGILRIVLPKFTEQEKEELMQHIEIA